MNETYPANQNLSMFESVTTLEDKKHFSNIMLSIVNPDGTNTSLISPNFPLLHKAEVFNKNINTCERDGGLNVRRNFCLHYFKISKICLKVDMDALGDSNRENKALQVCGIEHQK